MLRKRNKRKETILSEEEKRNIREIIGLENKRKGGGRKRIRLRRGRIVKVVVVVVVRIMVTGYTQSGVTSIIDM